MSLQPKTCTVASLLLEWWGLNGRKDLAWQRNPTRYRVWVSEIMLQQTQVATVERYYDRFMQSFPSVADLAAADSDRVLHLWSGLGYYARARNLHRAAQVIIDQHDGEVPGNLDVLQSLPGIGRSTAGAILALADDRCALILDGNAKRVYARLFGITGWPGQTSVLKELWAAADACTPEVGVSIYTQAIMDLGATVCRRLNPACDKCPLTGPCIARQKNLIGSIPGRRPQRVKPKRSTVIVVAVRADGAVLLKKRPNSGIWGGLWCFPETDTIERVVEWCHATIGHVPQETRVRPIVRHSFTHFDLTMTPVEARLTTIDARLMDGDEWLWYNRNQPAAIGLAAPVARLLKTIGETG